MKNGDVSSKNHKTTLLTEKAFSQRKNDSERNYFNVNVGCDSDTLNLPMAQVIVVQ